MAFHVEVCVPTETVHVTIMDTFYLETKKSIVLAFYLEMWYNVLNIFVFIYCDRPFICLPKHDLQLSFIENVNRKQYGHKSVAAHPETSKLTF